LFAAISTDGNRVATSSLGKPVATTLADGSVLTSTDKNHVVRALEVETGRAIFELPLPDGRAGPVAFSTDSHQLAVASRSPNRGLRVIDLVTLQERMLATDLSCDPTSVGFSPEGDRLVCGFSDGTALIWPLAKVKN
jgi:WD40 repeat protein